MIQDLDTCRNGLGHLVNARPTEEEVLALIRQAANELEEYLRLSSEAAEAALASGFALTSQIEPTYSWQNPIGLVVDPDQAKASGILG